jgi:hypothetical protein
MFPAELDGLFYFDKTLFIKDFIESENKLMLITYPDGSGKEIMVDMLQNFFEIDVDRKTGKKPDDVSQTKAFKIFNSLYGKSMLRKKLEIANHREIVDKYL